MMKGTITSIEGDRVTVEFSDGQKIRVPVSSVEGAPVQGSEIYLLVTIPGGEQSARSQFARDLLNQLLKG